MEAPSCCLLLLALSGALGPALAAPRTHIDTADTTDMWETGFRLDGHLVPTHYQITLTPDDETFQTYNGDLVIDMEVREEARKEAREEAPKAVREETPMEVTWDARTIILHAGKELFGFTRFPIVEEVDVGPLSVRSHSHSPNDGQYTIRLDEPSLLKDHKYRIFIKFSGKLTSDNRGFFRVPLKDGANTKLLAMTQFAPVHARRAFPCFDEPSFQATFSLSIVHPPRFVARSTTPVSVTGPSGKGDGFVMTTFETTPVISPHSLSWVVTDLDCMGHEQDWVHTFHRDGSAVEDLHAASKALLKLLYEYTGQEGPADVYQAVVPLLDRAEGSSLGMVAFREEAVLKHKQYKSPVRLAGMLSVANALAQQWFGNVVTPSWWGHAWLAVGFSKLLEYTLVDKTLPELQMPERFGVMEMMPALAADSRASAMPLTSDAINKNSEILAQMGILSSGKGAALLRMLRSMITEETFQKGVQYYISDMKHKTAAPEDLWTALQRAADEDQTAPDVSIAKFGKSWTEQVGYPVLTAVRDYERNTVLVYQAPYPLPGATGDDSRSWWVPLKLTSNTVDDLDPDENLISAAQPVVETWGPDTSKEWLLVNSDQMGYYRVNYDMFNWLRLIRAFKEDADNKLPSESSRAMLLDDALSLAAQGLLEYPVALRLMEALLVRERLPAPWIVAGRHLEHLAKFFRGASSKHEVAFDRWVRSLVEGAFADLGFPDDADEVLSALPTGALRGLVAKIACQAKHPECAAAARGQYLLWQMGGSVSGDSLALAVCHGVTGPWARPEALSTTIALLTGENGADVMQGLGCLSGQQRTDLIQSLVAGTRDMSVTKMAWKAITSGQTGLRLALDALLQNCDLIIKRFGSTFYAEILSDLAPSITTDAHLDALRELASHLNSLSHDSEIAAAAVSVAEDNVAWRKLYLDSVFDEVSSFDADPQGQAQGLSVRPNKVIPTNYALRLATAPQHADDPKKVQSSVEISVTVAEDTDLVSFHSGKGLALQHIAVTDGENEALFHWYNNNLWDGFDEFTMYSEESEMVSVRLDAPMLADKTYTVAIEFVPGYDVLAGDAEGGLFLSTLPDGVSTVTGARMEPNNAHRVFPCFDEPQFLATFSLTLAVTGTPKEALFVSPQKSISQDPAMPDTTIVDFETTRALPAHLLSLAAFDALATATARPSQPVPSGDTATVSSVRARTEVQTATPGAAKQAAALLELLDGALFERPPLARQEILAVPRLQGGPIISPGLAILREGDVLVVDKVSSSEQAVHAALAMANAQAHSFFGNDIMFEGWNSLWFREGLAAYLESWAVDKLNSGEYGAVNRAGVDRVHRGLALAAMETAAPLASAQGDLANRGLGVVRMVAGLLGEKALFNGLQAVLLDGPAKLSHVEVLQTLQAAADQPPPVDLVQLAESWTSQAGFPVLTLSRNYDDGTGFLRQEHFEWDAASRDAPDDRTWIVPYNVLTAKTAKTDPAPLLTEVLTTRSATVSLTGERGDVYMVLNAGQPGFYRVNYDSQNWQLLTKAAAAGELGEAQRATLLDDAVALCRAGRLDVAVVMDLLKAVTAVPQGAPLCVPCWTAARDALTTLGHLTRADPAHRAMYKRFVKEKLVNPSPVQWSALAGEDWAHGAMRAVVTQLACAAEDDVCLSEAKAALLDWQSNKDAFSVGVDPNVLAATICYMMSRAPAATDFTEVNVRITSTEDSSARRAYIAGLGCVRDEDMRSTLLKTTAAKSGVDISDVLPMFVSIMDNSDAPLAQVVDFVAENFDAMTENLGQDVANAVLYAVAERAHEDRHYSKLLSLVDGSASSSTSSSASVQAAVRRAAASRAWSATWQYKLVAWVYEQLDEVPPPDPEPTTPATTPASTTRPASTTPGVTTRPTTQSPTRPTTRPTTHRPTTQRPTTQPTPRPTTHKPNSAAAASTSVLALLLTALLVLLR